MNVGDRLFRRTDGAQSMRGAARFDGPDHLGGALQQAGMARAQGAIVASAGLLGFAGVLLPHPDAYFVPGMVAIQATAFVVGLALIAAADRVPVWVMRFNPPVCTALTSVVVFFAGDVYSPYPLFYFWTTIFSFYFFSRREAIFNLVFAVLNLALVIALVGTATSAGEDRAAAHGLVLVFGTLVVTGISLMALRERLSRLIGQLTDAARTDPLTGLRNRRGLQETLEAEVERARAGERTLSALIVDLDHFHEVNNRYGQEVGDRVLRRVGALLDQGTRRMDVVARTSGGEFAIVLPEVGKQGAYVISEQLMAGIRNRLGSEPKALTSSIGVAAYPEDGQDADTLLNAADHALYAAKILGRDRVVLFSDEVATILASRLGTRRTSKSQAHLATVLSLAEALDLRDTGTSRHSQTVGRLAELIARELGLPDDHVERVRLAGVLHDIGKIGIPDSVLKKPTPLSESEWSQIREHPEIGAGLIGSGQLSEVREWLWAHHERPDGRGYPRGLSGDEIPLEARILSVADAFEAMIADRPYRPGMGADAAREELLRVAGTQFDERVVEAMIEVLEQHGLEQLVAVE